jgi:hypothetical protein
MNPAQSQLFATAAEWLAYGRAELVELSRDVRDLAASTRTRWREDGSFRSRVFRQALEGLAAVVLKGPRATILWLMVVVANIVTWVALTLDQSNAF